MKKVKKMNVEEIKNVKGNKRKERKGNDERKKIEILMRWRRSVKIYGMIEIIEIKSNEGNRG